MDTKYKKTDPKSTRPLAVAYIAKHPTRFLFPLAAGRKGKPLIRDNLVKASNDPRQLAAWSKQFGADIAWGCAAKKSGLICVDVDAGPGKEGLASFKALQAQGLPFPKTETQRSPSGGYHMLYKGAHHFTASKIGKHIDTPNYFCIAGVVREDGRAYSMHSPTYPIADAPAWLAEKIRPRSDRPRANRAADAVPLDWFKRALSATPYSGGPAGLDDRSTYQGWLEFAMACHEAAGGDEADYLWAFIDWCLNDPNAKASWTAESIERHWQSFTADPAEGLAAVTRASWLKVLDATGAGKSIVGELSANDFGNAADTYSAKEMADFIASWDKRVAGQREAKRERVKTETAAGTRYSLKDFVAYLPEPDKFIFVPGGAAEMWPGSSVSLSCVGPAAMDPAKKDLTQKRDR